MVWQTNIYDPNITRIIALSDIHGDIHALIIALRDCAQVIKKKEGHIIPDELNLDMETEELLEMNLNDDFRRPINEKKYIDDLNYEWCGENTHVVICGDILDGYRINDNKRTSLFNSRCGNRCVENEYDQIEVKIYRFINAINKSSGNKIHKVLGNHEIVNLFNIGLDYSNFVPPMTKSMEFFYYNEERRLDYFKWNKEGARLIFEGGAGIFLKINNNLFVHGQLDHTKSLSDYEQINNELNYKINNPETNYDWLPTETTLFGRLYDNFYSKLNIVKHHQKCIDVKINLEKFIIESENYKVNDLRVIVGHCIQSGDERYNSINSTFSEIKKEGIREIVYGDVITGKVDTTDNEPNVFGISMECDKKTLDDPVHLEIEKQKNINIYGNDVKLSDNYIDKNERFIYKVDIGTSRAFDEFVPHNKFTEKIVFGSRVPQVLEITDTLKILRSTIKNTRIHQPRQHYESYASRIPELQLSNYKKYLKYKIKYNRLKNKIINTV